ncbi:MAG: hypothetical protein OEX07_04310 [Gammaproteobacteria bacterium]|nr:hypothetical protein [Gammaproteobacteria bacterium]
MNDLYQELVSTLSGKHNILLTSLLCTEDLDTWEECKHLIVCPIPLLTLEMAINRVSTRSGKRSTIPTPEEIKDALIYANQKRTQYLQHIAAEPATHI